MKILCFLREAFIVLLPFLGAVALTEAIIFGVPVHDPGVAFLIGMVLGFPGGMGSVGLWMERH